MKRDLTKTLDNFIFNALKNYNHVEEPWDELKKATGALYKDIISIKPSLPNLVLLSQNKFNKNKCFFSSENINGDNHFPRQNFFIKKRLLKNKSSKNDKEALNNTYKALESKIIKENNNNNDEMKQDDNIQEKKNDNNSKNEINNKDQTKNENINLNELYNNNKESRNWIIIYPNKNIYFNNEQLYYFLNEKFNDKQFNYDFYIGDSYYGKKIYDLRLVYEFLKLKFQEI